MTLEEATQLAMTNNPDVRALAASVDAARARLAGASLVLQGRAEAFAEAFADLHLAVGLDPMEPIALRGETVADEQLAEPNELNAARAQLDRAIGRSR